MLLLKQKNEEKEEFLNKKDKIIKELKEELEEKNT